MIQPHKIAHRPTPRCLAHTDMALRERRDSVLSMLHAGAVAPPMPKWERRLRSLIEWPLVKLLNGMAQ